MIRCARHNLKKEQCYFLETLRSNGGRITEQRKSIIEAIIKYPGPFSADELLSSIRKEQIDLVTIYRSLAKFTQLNLLRSVDLSDGTMRYEFLPEQEHHHHHIICKNCKSIEPINLCSVKKHEKQIAKMGYSNVSHKLEFFGICKKCAS
tara:strand:- start:37410 stop:37856 length:447 start_codon:yes stop_codon:yes gene_type:complete